LKKQFSTHALGQGSPQFKILCPASTELQAQPQPHLQLPLLPNSNFNSNIRRSTATLDNSWRFYIALPIHLIHE
jgi:hypothetical protein